MKNDKKPNILIDSKTIQLIIDDTFNMCNKINLLRDANMDYIDVYEYKRLRYKYDSYAAIHDTILIKQYIQKNLTR